MQTAIQRFMYGRNGVDQLARFSVWTLLLFDLLTMVIRRFSAALGDIMYWAAMIAWGWMLFRIFSRNLWKRQEENRKFMMWSYDLRTKISGAKQRHADTDHKYYTCKTCRTVCRVPVNKGTIIITCPKCGSQFKVRT